MEEQTKLSWAELISRSFDTWLTYLNQYSPKLIGALILLIVGWIAAILLSKLTHTLILFLGRLIMRIAPAYYRERGIDIKPLQLAILRKCVFWLVFLFFVATAANTLGLDFFASTLGDVIVYLPKVFAGALIIFAGFLVGAMVRGMVRPALESAGLKQPDNVANVLRLAIIFTTLVIGVEQIGVDMHFVTTLVIVLAGVLCSGVALAFGLGCKNLLANIAGARQARRHCELREMIKIGGVEGRLIDITSTTLIIEHEKGRCLVPAKLYLEEATVIFTHADDELDAEEQERAS